MLLKAVKIASATILCLILALGLVSAVVNFIPGKGCGSLTPIKRIKKMPTDPEEIAQLECVIVEDEQSYLDYINDKPSKPLRNIVYRVL